MGVSLNVFCEKLAGASCELTLPTAVSGPQAVGMRMKGPRAAAPRKVSAMRWIWTLRPADVRGWSAKVVSSA